MADILTFPDRREAAPKLRPVPMSTRRYNRDQIVHASEALAAALAETAGSLRFLGDGNELDETSAILSGETLQSALTGILHLMNIRGRAADEDLRLAVRRWLANNGGHNGN